MRHVTLFVVFLMLSPRVVAAAPIVLFDFVGSVTTGSSSLPSLPVGTSVRFTVPFDYGATDLCAASSSGLYMFGGSTLAYGSSSYTSQSTFLEVNAPDGACIGAPAGATLRLIDFAGAPFASATLDLLGPGLGNDNIPGLPVPAAGFSVNLVGHGFGGIAAATGPISQVSPVPEPTSSILFLSGLAYTAVRQRRKRTSM